MDKINQLRRLAGMPYDLSKDISRTPPASKKSVVKEAYKVPQRKADLMPENDANHAARVGATKQAIFHLTAAIKQLEAIPAMNFDGDIPHFVEQLKELLGGDNQDSDGLQGLSLGYQHDHDQWKTKEAGRVKQEQEEEDISAASHEAVDHHNENEDRLQNTAKFEKGQKASLHGKPVTVIVASDESETVGVVPCGEEDNVDAIELVHANELEQADDIDDEQDDSVDMEIDLDSPEDDHNGEINQPESANSDDDDEPGDDDLEVIALGSGDNNDDVKHIKSSIGGQLGECTPGAWIKTKDGQAGVVAYVSGDKVTFKPHNTPEKSVTTTMQNVVTEGGMPSSVIKHKQKLSEMSNEDLAKRFTTLAKEQNRKPEDLARSTARSHGYGKNSSHYWDRIKSHVTEGVNYYYDKAEEGTPLDVYDGKKNANNVWKEIDIKDKKQVKDENPNQLFSLGAASDTDNERKVKIPASVKSSLKSAMDEVEAGFKRLSSVETDAHFFYNSLLNAFEQILQYLEVGTVYSVKQAQIFMTSLMGPILFKIPADVKNFIAKGGETRSLKDYMKPVDSKYPITGPRQVLK